MRKDGEFIPTNVVGYKCPTCALVRRWNVAIRPSEFDSLLAIRGGNDVYYPPIEEWTEDDRIAQQLEALGYFGGRRDDFVIRED